MTPTEVKQRLVDLGIRATKIRGQHFLIDEKVLHEMVRAAELVVHDAVLEIGPGLGVLTRELLRYVGCVTAVEIDRMMAGNLAKELGGQGLVVTLGDVRHKSTKELADFCRAERYKLVANIPYNITSEVLEKFLEEEPTPSMMVLLVQRELAERVIGREKQSRLSIFVNYFGHPEIIRLVSREAFWPAPRVQSAVLRIRRYPPEALRRREVDFRRKDFFRIVRAGFGSPRRKLVSNLAGGLNLSRDEIEAIFLKANIPLGARAEHLSFEQWITLARFICHPRP